MRNPEREHLDVNYKDNNITAVYRPNKRSYPLRIARTSRWDRAILRMMHANIRMKGADALTSIDLIIEEFKELLDKADPDRIKKFNEYVVKLRNKPEEQLGVNV